jgi:hypothetical protein
MSPSSAPIERTETARIPRIIGQFVGQNRGWTRDRILRNSSHSTFSTCEDQEQVELLSIFRDVLSSAVDEVYAIDLHSTSAGGRPFATVGDTLRNRRFALKLPVTVLVGI